MRRLPDNYDSPKVRQWKLEGELWQIEMFGVCRKESVKPPFLRWWLSIEDAIKRQKELGWNPAEPKTEPAQKLFRGVESRLQEPFKSQLQFFCALGTPLDIHHGADGIFTTDGRVFATIDLARTLRGKLLKNRETKKSCKMKGHLYREHVVVARDSFQKGREESFGKMCWKIVDRLTSAE